MRTCGECIVCCVYPRIEDPQMSKAAMVHCSELRLSQPVEENVWQFSTDKKRPCKIYDDETKPEICSYFRCMWLKGHGEEEDRPDKSLIMIDRGKEIENAVECKQLAEGAADSVKGKLAIERISRDAGMVALVLSLYERKLMRVVGKTWLS